MEFFFNFRTSTKQSQPDLNKSLNYFIKICKIHFLLSNLRDSEKIKNNHNYGLFSANLFFQEMLKTIDANIYTEAWLLFANTS